MKNIAMILGMFLAFYGIATLDSDSQLLSAILALCGVAMMIPWLVDKNKEQKGANIARERRLRKSTRDFTGK